MATTPTAAAFSITLDCRLDNVPGTLGRLALAIGEAGGNIGALDGFDVRGPELRRCIVVHCRDEAHQQKVVEAVRALKGVTLVDWWDRTFRMHEAGKIHVLTSAPVNDRDDLSMAYTPGVARVCMAIHEDPSLSHRYTIRATIRVGGALLYATTNNDLMLTEGAVTDAGRLKLERVADTKAVPDRPVEGAYWKLKTLGGTTVTFTGPGREPNLTLHPSDHRATGSGGCNTFTGSYTLKPPALTFGAIAGTRRACVNGAETEAAYFAALARVRSFSVTGDALTLSDKSGKALATFVAVDF